MRFIFQATALCALVLTRVSAERSGLFLANGMELDEYRVGDEIMYGEPVSHLYHPLPFLILSAIDMARKYSLG